MVMPPSLGVRDGPTFYPTLEEHVLPIDPLLIPFVLVALGILCAAAVCIVALIRAERTDVVAVVRALPELASTLARYRRRPRR